MNAAVTSAKAAFDSGVWKDPAFRKATLLKFADLIVEHRDPLMDALIYEVGSPINLKANHIDTPATFLRSFAEHGTRDRTRHLGPNATNTAFSMVAYRPVGVVAAITAFNYPLLIGVSKMEITLQHGLHDNPVVAARRLAVLLLGDLVRRAGFPPRTSST